MVGRAVGRAGQSCSRGSGSPSRWQNSWWPGRAAPLVFPLIGAAVAGRCSCRWWAAFGGVEALGNEQF